MKSSTVLMTALMPTLLASLVFGSCTQGGRKTTGPKQLALYFSDDVKSADPAQTNDQISLELMGNIFEGLLEFSYLGRTDEVKPNLSEAMPAISKDGRSYSFRIRKGVFFHNDPAFPNGQGRELVASDFVYSFKRIADPRNGSVNWWFFDGVVEGFNEWRDGVEKAVPEARDAAFAKPVSGLSAPDDRSLVIRLKKPYPQFRFILAMTNTSVVAKEVVDKYGPEIINHPIGTGPFRLKDWIRGSKVIVEKNPTYRGDFYPNVASDPDRASGLLLASSKAIPFVQEIHWDIIKEEQPRWLKFKKGELDYAKIPKDNFEETIDVAGNLKPEFTAKNMKLAKQMSLTTWWIEFNLKDPIFQNRKLRMALAHAFDRARALSLLYNNRGVLSASPLPPGIEGAEDLNEAPYKLDLEKAKQLLAEAGYPGGKGLPELSFDLRGPGTTPRQLGELLKDNFDKIGVKMSILANSFPEALEKAKTGRFQMMLGGWAADYPDPENFMQLFTSTNAAPGPNSSNFKNPEFDKLYQQIRTQEAGAARRKAIKRMGEILQTELPVIFFFHQVDYYVSQPWLLNFKPHLLLAGWGKFLDTDTSR